MKVDFSPREERRLVLGLFLVTGLLIASNLFIDLGGMFPIPALDGVLRRQLDFSYEHVFATWYAGMALFVTGLVAALNGWQDRGAAGSVGARVGWTFVAAFFAALSADELCEWHEQVGAAVGARVGEIPGLTAGLGSGSSFTWLLVLAPVALGAIAGMLWFLRTRVGLSKAGWALALGGTLCWVGAVGMEYLEAHIKRLGILHGIRGLRGTAEESLEVIGTLCFFAAFLGHLRSTPRIRPPAPR